MVLFSVAVPELEMPPPSAAESLARVELMTVSVPELKMPPPSAAESLARVELMTVSVPELKMPPPSAAESLARVELMTVAVPKLKMPPPSASSPPVMVRPLIAAVVPASTSNTRLALLPLTLIWAAPGPYDRHVVGDLQHAAGQHDRPAQAEGEVDRVQAGIGVGVEDRLPQRAGTAVAGVRHHEGPDDGDLTDPTRRSTGAAGGPSGYVDVGQAPGEATRPGHDADATAATTAAITGPLPTTAGATFGAQRYS